MNLLKQTALILGLASLSIGVWSLYRNWKHKLAITFSVLCFFISIWALSFVSHATLAGRLSKDIHWFFHVWLVPICVTILSKILIREDLFSRSLRWVSFFGAMILSTMIAFSLGSGEYFWWIVSYWPGLVLVEYAYVMAKDLFLGTPVSVDFFSPVKRVGLYFGLAVSMITCSFDHIPGFGLTVPALGNLLLTVYLLFLSQMVSPQKILNLQAIVSRFFATVILALVITGFYALLYQYMSESFPLFFLNSFLISFAVLALWNPLITFFRFIGRKFSSGKKSAAEVQLEKFLTTLPMVTDARDLDHLLQESFAVWIQHSEIKVVWLEQNTVLPVTVEQFFTRSVQSGVTPVIHRELIRMEKDQAVTTELHQRLEDLLQYLEVTSADIIFPVFSAGRPVILILISAPVFIDDLHLDLSFYTNIHKAIQEIEKTWMKINQIESAKERDRLILLGEMAAGLAHEVRNPLGAIQGASNLIASNDDPWVKVIQDEVQRLNRLVNQFLDFANAPSDQVEKVNLVETLQRSIENLSPFYGKQVEIRMITPDEMIWAMGVPDHLQQILMNLIQNALKAQSSIVEVEIFDSGFAVKDNGVGMSSAVKSRIFQPFFSTFKTGTGLGLSICERLVKFSGGQISVESTEGMGTQVKIDLQRAQV